MHGDDVAELEEKIPDLKSIPKWHDYKESFSYCIPFSSDLEAISVETYVNRAKVYVDGAKMMDCDGETEVFVKELDPEKIDYKIQQLKKSIAELEDLRGPFAKLSEGMKFLAEGKVSEVAKDLEAYKQAAKILSKAELIHHGPANTLNDLQKYILEE